MEFNTWNKEKYKEFIDYLISLKDDKYKEFNSKLITTKYKMLGIRMPLLRKIASDIFKSDYQKFLEVAGTNYFEEVMIKGFVIAKIKDIKELEKYFDNYIDLIDNWAINDSFCNSLKIVNKNKDYFMNMVLKLINRGKEYHLRVGLIILLNFYIQKEYLKKIFGILDNINSDLYYVNMACAWLLCEVFTKYSDITLEYLENNKLNKFTINKTVSKIRDSYRVSKELKDYVLKYRRN